MSWERQRRVNSERKSGVKPRRRICDQTDTPPAASQRNWYQMYWVSFPLEHTSNAERGTLTHGQTQVLHIICPGLRPGEDVPGSPHGVDTTREAIDHYSELLKTVCLANRPELWPLSVPSASGTATPELVFTATKDAVQWVQIYASHETDRCQ